MQNGMSKLKHLEFDQREVDFILQNIELDGYDVILPNDANYLERMYKNYGLDPNSLNYFNPKTYLVSNESIRWFKDDLRAALWFYAFLVIKQKWPINLLSVHGIFTKDFILSFDCFYEINRPTPNGLRNFLTFFKTRAIRIAVPYFHKCKTSRDYLRWLNESNREQMEWALDYLQEKELLINAPNFMPINTKECYAQVCASLDALDMHPDLQQKLADSYPRGPKESIKANNANQVHDGVMDSQTNQVITRNRALDQDMNNQANIPQSTALDGRPNSKAFRALVKEVHEASNAKRELLTRMRTAWNQKVFRDKKPVKAEKNLKLPHGYEKKLKEISEAYDEDIVVCLKRVIDEEYRSVKSDG